MRRIWSGRRGPLIVLTAGCLLGPLLAGCSSNDPPSVDPTHHPGTAPTTTSTPSVTPDRLGLAIAAVSRMYAEYNNALKSGRTAAYRATFVGSCQYCVTNAQLIDAFTRKGQTVVGGKYTLRELKLAADQPKFVLVQGYVSQAAARVMMSDKVVQRYKAVRPFLAVWRVIEIDGHWVISDEDVH